MPLTEQQAAEIDAARSQRSQTARPTVAALEAMLFEALPVLDHGFVRVIDYMGDDSAIVQAARVSYGRGTRRVSEDAGLIRYLMRHYHSTPFEMCEIKYHVKLPIFVARQWIRHRTANVNEYSARYSILDREFYLPAPEHLAAQSVANRQGRGDVLAGDEAAHVLDLLREDATRCYDHYAEMLNEDATGAALDPSRQGLARGGVGAARVSGVPRLPAGCCDAVGADAGDGAADAGRRGGGAGEQWAEQAGMGGTEGGVGARLNPALFPLTWNCPTIPSTRTGGTHEGSRLP
jgi:flavin-dependent thymidylate synthase